MARASGSASPQSFSNSVTSFFGDFLLQQAALGVRRHVPFHDANDVVAQLLTADVGRKITLVRRKGPGGGRGNPKRRPGDLQQFDDVVPGHGGLRLPAYDHAAMARRWQRRPNARSAAVGAPALAPPSARPLRVPDRAPPGWSTSTALEPGVAILARLPS